MTMTQQELQAKLQQEQNKQVSMYIAETNKKAEEQMRILNQLNAYLPKVNEWLKMLNMISQSGVRYYILSTDYIQQDFLKKCWEVITNGITHKYGIYGTHVRYGEAITKGHFTRMGCEGGGCNGDDVWTDGQNWYHGSVKLRGRIDEISTYKARGIIKQIQKFETYFNELLETLG
jgi:hypothetical protein